MTNTGMTVEQVETLAREQAAALGLTVTVRAYAAARVSPTKGREVKVRVHCTDSKRTWRQTIALGRAMAKVLGVGRVFSDKHSHYETRMGAGPTTTGWLTGSQADIRVFPDAQVTG